MTIYWMQTQNQRCWKGNDEAFLYRRTETLLTKNIKGRTRKELCEMFNEHFNLNLGLNQITAYIKNNGLNSGIDTRFTKGQDSWNKGQKEFVPVEYRRNFKRSETA